MEWCSGDGKLQGRFVGRLPCTTLGLGINEYFTHIYTRGRTEHSITNHYGDEKEEEQEKYVKRKYMGSIKQN